MNLKDTVKMMLSEDYRERFRAEYHQTKIRYEKLHRMCIKYEAGVLLFKPTCSLELLKQQKAAMGQYLYYLEMRAELEHIDLEDLATMKTCECAGEEGCGREAAPVEDDTECDGSAPGALGFEFALAELKVGKRAARKGWNGKGMYVFLADEVEFHTKADMSEFNGVANGVYVEGLFVLRTAQGNLQPGWLASLEDMLAEDWVVFD